ncbi:ubiquinone/menaquinone biosynthesis C-methylase UbiE/peptidoglycan/xylan/chitin deacetylase (PgdA/CDA1 family) [Desulfobaculum xiamenense]|uniref:Ubiquinone/menaquinone biosynthesis C-methylase UbiE/peptidoglycan/xylan/chitin deacetylase (PgdA/CDA1 family) n=1 Tax=Desulfobaculum xiamenense TaxID=995050 RepID=A0A846QUJ5_9BACT|nr:methyltransferase domain-containing protein [Desulfobaculum xiamenense]NJB69195.1 ubiquinone/menaquinone biosynthesis C-methylase UbiE/peptidoglycan/xylan/chitin deacetylase (PgdA/CDA1 family) [Desulfobaculum xiamenense]
MTRAGGLVQQARSVVREGNVVRPQGDAPALPGLTKAYRAVFDELAEASRYAVAGLGEFLVDRVGRGEAGRVSVALRVDVDPGGFQFAVPLARELKARGLGATFFFLTDPVRHYALWGSGVAAEVAGMGFEVGVHSDHLHAQLTRGEDGLAQLRADIDRLSAEAGRRVRGVVAHGHPGIDRLGRSNRDLYSGIAPGALGLDYHDGAGGGYVRDTPSGPLPPCELWLIDYFGYPGGSGWTLWPAWPIARLRTLRPGDVAHVVLHPLNAFRWWEGFDARYGEVERPRPSLPVRAWRGLSVRVRHGLLRGRGLSYALAVGAADALAWVLARGLGLVWPRGGREETDTTWETGREVIFARGVEHWREHLERLGMPAPGGRVLEVGSGDGQWLLAYARDAAEVVGVEPGRRFREASLVTIAAHPAEASRIRVQDAVAESLPFPDAHFDRVHCAGVFMFTRQREAMAEMARVLTPGGRLCLTANGIGWFVMYCLEGLRHRSAAKMRYGVKGLAATLLWWWFGRETEFPRAVSATRMRALMDAHGLELLGVRYFQGVRMYADEYAGLPANYAFVAVRRGDGDGAAEDA